VVSGLSDWAAGQGWQVRGVTESPITGPAGNVEYLLWLTKPGN
jgi:23S rRNA (cytidine1920-2'-O)/16S rRNA (cytidine1409-2'-O)-methyltransferase